VGAKVLSDNNERVVFTANLLELTKMRLEQIK